MDNSPRRSIMLKPIRDLWRDNPGVAAIVAAAFILWLLLAPALDAPAAAEGLIFAAAVAVWSRLADL